MTQSSERISDKGRSIDGRRRILGHSILTRYVLREYLKFFALALLGLLSLSLLIEFFERMDNFIENHAEMSAIIEYFILFIPKVVFYGIPMAVLLSTILTLGILSRNSEIIAMRAAGVSLYSIAIPILAVAFLTSVFTFVFNESLIFSTNQQLNYVKDVKIKKKQPHVFFQKNKVWMRGKDNTIINIELVHPGGEHLYGVTVYKFDDKFDIIERVDAKEARYLNKWVLLKGRIRSFPPEGGIKDEVFDNIYYKLPEQPENFRKLEKKSEEMNILELNDYIKKLKITGYKALRHIVDMHAKISFAFVSFIMALFAVPFSFRSGRTEGIVIGIGTSILIAFFYWIVFNLGISLGHQGVFPPIFSAWIGNVLFGASGLYMFMSIRQ